MGENFVAQNYSSGKIFVTKRKIRHFHPESFRQILIILLGETLSGETIRRAKFSSLFKKFVTFAWQSFAG